MAPSLPEGWEADCDGNRWFYRHKTTGLVQFSFPDPGDEHTWYGTSSPPAERLPEEKFVSSPQVKKTNTAEQTGTASNESPDRLDEGVTSATLPPAHYPPPRRRRITEPSSDGEEAGSPHEPAAGKDKVVLRANEDESRIRDSGTPTRVGTVCKYFVKGNCKFGPKCANIHILPDGRRINYGKNGNLTIAPSPVALGVGQSPNAKGLSVLREPPPIFDSNGTFIGARYGPWPSSVPSKFGLESPSSSLNAAKDARTAETPKLLYDSTVSYQPSSTFKVGGINGFGSSPPVDLAPYTGLGGEELYRKAIHNSSFRYSKPRAIRSSVPKLDRDWDAEFLSEEDYVPGALANEVLTAAEKARRGSTNTVDFILPQGEEHGGLLTETSSERDGPNPTLIPAKGPSSATAATENATTSHVCRHCQREFPRFHDLIKHSKSHSRPFKCPFSTCKYYDHGWPTDKELERHVHDKHSAPPRTFSCQYASCTYESKRESNCRQHMERKHGWIYVRSKSAGKQLGSQQTTEDPIQPSKMPLGRPHPNQSYADITRATDDSPLEILMQRIEGKLPRKEDILDEWGAAAGLSRTLARDASGSKAGLDMSTSSFDIESSVGPSAWNEGRTTNDSAPPTPNAGDGTVQSHETTYHLFVEELSDFTDSNTEQPGIIRRDAVGNQDSEHSKGISPRHPGKLPFERAEFGRLQFSSSSGDSDSDNAEDQEFLERKREAKPHKRMNDAQIGRRTDDFLEEYENDDDLIAEANTSVLANDADGFYGQEFGFYSAPLPGNDYSLKSSGAGGALSISEVLGSGSDVEDLRFSYARDPGPSARRLRRRTNPASKHLLPSAPELEKPDSSSDGDSEPTGYNDASGRGRAAGHGDAKKVRHRLEARSKPQDGRSQPPLPLVTRAKILGTALPKLKRSMTSPHYVVIEQDRPRLGKHDVPMGGPIHVVDEAPRHRRRNSTKANVVQDDERERRREKRDQKRRLSTTSPLPEATTNAQMLDWLDPDAAHGTEDSDTSDLESIMSEAPSIASSRSSVPLNIDLGAIQELRTLLLTNEALIPLYNVAISKVGPEKFYRNFRRFLLRYGRALGSEATSSVQLEAARFVRSAASRVSMQIKESISNRDGKEQEKGKQNAKALGDYLKQTQDADDSSTEDSEHDPEEASLQTLESVKSFMLSSAAFFDLCHSLRVWLGVDSQNKQPAPALTMIKLEVKESAAGEALTASRDHQPTPLKEKIAKLRCGPAAKTASSLMLVELEEAPAKWGEVSREGPHNWVSVIRMTRKLVSNRLSDLWQASPPPGYVKVSWICRCGDILRIQVPEAQQMAAIAFAKQAAGPNSSTVVSQSSAGTSPAPSSSRARAAAGTADQNTDRPNLTPSSSNASATTDTITDSYSTSVTTRSASSRPESPNTIPSDEELSQPEPFLPAGTKKYMLLCVNTSGPRGIPQRKLANVDVTDVECGAEMFQRLRNTYYALRPRRNPFFVPKTMHYIKFQLLFLQKSGECIGAYEVDSIPSRNEVIKQDYAFSPCPPRIGKLPLPPDIFMHGFLDPCDHLGPMAVEMLPKKLWSQLRWDVRANDRYNVPAGWGFYIVEGINWPLVSWCTAVALIAVTALTMSWSILAGDVQGGTGLGQYCLAVLTVTASAWLLKCSVEPSS